MTKAELIKKVSELTGETQTCVGNVLNAIANVVKLNLVDGEETNLGPFSVGVVAKSARIGRNPKTGVEVEIPARMAVKVRVGKALKDAANGVAN